MLVHFHFQQSILNVGPLYVGHLHGSTASWTVFRNRESVSPVLNPPVIYQHQVTTFQLHLNYDKPNTEDYLLLATQN